MITTFYADDDTGSVYAAILHSEFLQELMRDPGADNMAEVARGVLAEMGAHVAAWPEWTEAVEEARLTYLLNNPDEEDEE